MNQRRSEAAEQAQRRQQDGDQGDRLRDQARTSQVQDAAQNAEINRMMARFTRDGLEQRYGLSPQETSDLNTLERNFLSGNIRGMANVLAKYERDPDKANRLLDVFDKDLASVGMYSQWDKRLFTDIDKPTLTILMERPNERNMYSLTIFAARDQTVFGPGSDRVPLGMPGAGITHPGAQNVMNMMLQQSRERLR